MDRALAWGRIGLGLGLVVVPGVAARTWFGQEAPAARLMLRSIGARDVALGVGLLTSADGRPWLLAGIGADIVDCLASLRSAGEISASKILPGSVLALAFAAAGVIEARRTSRSLPRPSPA